MNTRFKQIYLAATIAAILLITTGTKSQSQGFEGYYRYPDVHGNTVAFVAEGDIWTVPLEGGLARRLTTHPEEELYPRISPDGKTIVYSADYEGPTEIYTIPVTGGLPTRWTYESDFSFTNGWTPDGKIVYDTRAYSSLPERQLVTINLSSGKKERVPLSQGSEASYDDKGSTVYFVRPAYHGNVTKRYEGGTARQIWKFTTGTPEAVKLTTDNPGESFNPMWFGGRVYFITGRDGVMNIWSMDETGSDLRQHTFHRDFDVRYAGISDGNIVYQLGADIWNYNTISNKTAKIDIRLASDLDQLREKWVENPASYITSVNPDKKGERIVITARGRVFVAPVKSGRFVEFSDKKNVRYRDAIFSADGEKVFVLSDESGEFEFIGLPSDGIGPRNQLRAMVKYSVLGRASPDGRWPAHITI
ncbi:MAG: hypothetical protein R2727_09745 [Bacteroidales bacterium]